MIYFVIFLGTSLCLMLFVLAKTGRGVGFDFDGQEQEYFRIYRLGVFLCTYTENTVYQTPRFLFLGLVFFASENIQTSCLVCLFQSVNTHMGLAEPLQKLQVCVYSSRMNGMLSFLLVLLIGLQCSQHIKHVQKTGELSTD